MSQAALIKANDILIGELCKDTNYVIQKDGLIYSYILRTGKRSKDNSLRQIAGHFAHDGYRRICYRGKVLMVHRIIFQKFVGQLDHSKQINHKDGNRTNNSVENLELVDQSLNMKHAYKVLKRPAVIGFKRINQDIANKIRELAKRDNFTFKEIAKFYGIGKSTVSDVVNNRTWKAKP